MIAFAMVAGIGLGLGAVAVILWVGEILRPPEGLSRTPARPDPNPEPIPGPTEEDPERSATVRADLARRREEDARRQEVEAQLAKEVARAAATSLRLSKLRELAPKTRLEPGP